MVMIVLRIHESIFFFKLHHSMGQHGAFDLIVLKNHFFSVYVHVFDLSTVVSCLFVILHIFYISQLSWDFLNPNIVQSTASLSPLFFYMF